MCFGRASNASYGAPDSIWGNRPEHVLNAAIRRLDVTKYKPGQRLNAMTVDAGGPYNPFAPGAPLTIYASGVRNALDLVWTHDGVLFAPNNGSSPPGNAPGSPDGSVPASNGVTTYEEDYLYKIVPGGYYGHPNPTIGHYVLDGGNPAAGGGSDLIPQYPVGTNPDPAYKGYVFDFGPHPSPNGIIEYQDHTFGGKLQNALLVTEYGQGNDIIALARNVDGSISGQLTVNKDGPLPAGLTAAIYPARGNLAPVVSAGPDGPAAHSGTHTASRKAARLWLCKSSPRSPASQPICPLSSACCVKRRLSCGSTVPCAGQRNESPAPPSVWASEPPAVNGANANSRSVRRYKTTPPGGGVGPAAGARQRASRYSMVRAAMLAPRRLAPYSIAKAKRSREALRRVTSASRRVPGESRNASSTASEI